MGTTTRIEPPQKAKFYNATWTASSSSANRTNLTDALTLPTGRYIVIANTPTTSAWFWSELMDSSTTTQITSMSGVTAHSPSVAYMCTGQSFAWIIEVTAYSVSIRLKTAQSASVTFSNTGRGGLHAVRLSY